jgi:hypothetical protein
MGLLESGGTTVMTAAKFVEPKWKAVGCGIVTCDVCGKDDRVIFLRRGSGKTGHIYRCCEHAHITDWHDPKQVDW